MQPFVCLDGVDAGDKYRLSAYSNANACFIFIPLIAIWEIDTIIQYSHFFLSPAYWFMLIISGVGGFAIGIVTMLQIQVHVHLSFTWCVVGSKHSCSGFSLYGPWRCTLLGQRGPV
jgi:hypothetical protein